MGFSSQTGITIIGTQNALDEPVAALETTGVAMRLTSGALTLNREGLVYDPEIGGGRDIGDSFLGPASVTGTFEFYTRFGSSTATLLRAALGGATSTQDTGYNTHAIVPTDASALPFLSVHQQISSGLEVANFQDCVVNTFHLEADANGFLTGSAELIGRRQALDVPALDPTDIYDNSTGTVGTSVVITMGGVNIKPKSFSLDIANNFEDDDFRLGQFFLEDLTPKRREVTISTTLRHQDKALLRQATLGAPTATTVGGLTTKSSMVITITSYEMISGTAVPHSLTLTFPNVVAQPFALEPSGDDILESDVEWRAVRPSMAVPVLTAELVNGEEAIA